MTTNGQDIERAGLAAEGRARAAVQPQQLAVGSNVSEITDADRQATFVAGQFTAAGWNVELRHNESSARYFRDGEVMLCGRRYTWVKAARDATERGRVSSVHIGWSTVTEPRPGQRRTTRFHVVHVHRYAAGDTEITNRKRAYALFSSLINDGDQNKPESEAVA